MRIVITGITGPVGTALVDYLLTLPDLKIHAFTCWRSDVSSIKHLRDRVVFHEGDIKGRMLCHVQTT
jgi:GDP-4-dehydro-6-deoxy-D-mannose reductase